MFKNHLATTLCKSPLPFVALAIAIATFGSNRCRAQQLPLSPSAERVHRQVMNLPAGVKISIIRKHGPETYGTLLSSDAVTFTYHDVDDNFDKNVPYEEVKKVKEGYGGYNSHTRRHTDRTKALIAGAAVLGLLLAITIAAAGS